MKSVLVTAVALGCIAVGQTMVWITEAGAENGTYRLGEIVVAAAPENIVESAGTVYRVTAAQIKEQNAKTLDEALQLVPGVIIREGAEGTPRIDVRGFRTRHVQLFMNGVPVRTSYDGQFDPTTIPAENIAEIKVTSGGGSVLYGAGGNGAAIDIITKGGEPGVHGIVGGEIGEGNWYEARGAVFASEGKVDFYGSAITQSRDEFILSDDFEPTKYEDGEDRLNSDRERTSMFSNLSLRATDATTLGITFSHVNGENGKPPRTKGKEDPYLDKNPKFERIDDLSSSLVQFAADHQTGGPLDLRGWAYYSKTKLEDNVYKDETFEELDTKKSETTETEIYGASAQAIYEIGDAAKATLGLTGEKETWQSDKATDDDIDAMETYSVALEYERQLARDVGMVVGYGYHLNDQDEGGDDDDFSYILGIAWDINDATRLRANHARKIRFPSLKQINDAVTDLDTEVTYHYEVGVDRQLWNNKAILSITGFYIDAEDFIEKDRDDVTRNYQDLTFQGIETDLKVYPVDELMVRFALTWLDTEDDSADSDRDELQYRPEWTVTTEMKYRFDFGLSAYGSVQYIGDQYFYGDDGTEKGQLNDITVVNLKLTQAVGVSGFDIYGGVTNLFDTDYEESYALPQPGRMFYAGVEYAF